jgi:hypothetical protein
MRSVDKTTLTFGFILEIILISIISHSYRRALVHRNFAFWGLSFMIFLFHLRSLVFYTFAHYSPFVIYLSFISLVFLGILLFYASSPIFFPRIQWWEYDFRYRGDLKGEVIKEVEGEDKHWEIRLTDLRRFAACVESFESLNPGDEVKIKVYFKNNVYFLPFIIISKKIFIPGRPIKYGLKLASENTSVKSDYLDLKSSWDNSRKVKLREKFSRLKEK